MFPTPTEAEIEPYVDKKFIAKTTWATYLAMVSLSLLQTLIVRYVHPAPDSSMEQIAGYLKLIAGNTLAILPIYILAFIADKKLRDERKSGGRTWLGRAVAGALAFMVLRGLGALVSGLTAFALK